MWKRPQRQPSGGTWRDGRTRATLLLARLLEEAGELARELRHIEQVSPTPEEAMQVRKEAADVANYAMMIADNYGDLKAIREAHSRLFSGPME